MNNPYDILKNDKAKRMLENTKVFVNRPDILKKAENTVANYTFSYITGATCFLGSAFALLSEIGGKSNFKEYLIEQITYLAKRPSEFDKELRYNIVLSALYFKYLFNVRNNANRFQNCVQLLWNMIKKRSIMDGMVESCIATSRRDNKDMWFILSSPVVLILNQHLYNNIVVERATDYIKEIIRVGSSSSDIIDVMVTSFPTIFGEKYLDFSQKHINQIIQEANRAKVERPAFYNVVEFIRDSVTDIFCEAKTYDKKVYETYREQILKWTNKYDIHKEDERCLHVKKILASMDDYRHTLGNQNSSNLLPINAKDIFIAQDLFQKELNVIIPLEYLNLFHSIKEVASFIEAFKQGEDTTV